MVTLIAFVVILGLLVFVHELGHFVAAKKAGVRVDEFGFGFPPRLFGIKRGETTYSINLIPIGGFVKIYGESGEGQGEENSFTSKKGWVRALILSAGVLMNILLAFILLSIGFKVGLPTVVEPGMENVRDPKVQVLEVSDDTPAAQAGLEVGDEIINIGGQEVAEVTQVQKLISEAAGETVSVVVSRGGEEVTLEVAPRANPPEGEGPLGIGLVETGIVSYPWYESIAKGFVTTFSMLAAIVIAFGGIIKNLFVGQGLAPEISGPVGIAVLTGQMAKMGFVYLLQFAAILSINLALLNILPLPALDGGRLLFLGIEKVRGKPVSPRIESIVHSTGFVLLILLMVLVTFRDVSRFSDVFINFWDNLIGGFRG